MNLDAPSWFNAAINTPYTTHTVDANGCAVVYQAWGSPRNPGLFLLHGNGAHSHWWDFIAPSFAEHFYVVAPSLSGMGDSGHRDHYAMDIYVDEIKAVCDAVGFVQKPLLIGHSMGGRLVFNAEKKYPNDFHGVIMVDSPFHPPEKKFDFDARRRIPLKPHRVYTDLDAAIARFRLFPAQPCANQYIVNYIGRHSLKAVNSNEDEGWQWKFDPKTYSQFDYENMLSSLPEPGNKILAMIYGEQSDLFPTATVKHNQQLFSALHLPELIGIADAHHHLFLDQPLAFIEQLHAVLGNL